METEILRLLLYIMTIGLLSCLVIWILIYCTTIYRHNIEKTFILKDYSQTELKLAESNKNNDFLKYIAISQFKKNCTAFNNLCRVFEQGDNSIARKSIIYDAVENEMASISKDKILYDAEQVLNTTHDNIILKLRKQYPNLREDYIKIAILNGVGYNINTIGYILSQNVKTVYTNRSRLRNSIKEGGEFYLDLLKKQT